MFNISFLFLGFCSNVFLCKWFDSKLTIFFLSFDFFFNLSFSVIKFLFITYLCYLRNPFKGSFGLVVIFCFVAHMCVVCNAFPFCLPLLLSLPLCIPFRQVCQLFMNSIFFKRLFFFIHCERFFFLVCLFVWVFLLLIFLEIFRLSIVDFSFKFLLEPFIIKTIFFLSVYVLFPNKHKERYFSSLIFDL